MDERKLEKGPGVIEREMFKKHRKFLEENVDPDFGLLDKLKQTDALSGEVVAEIEAGNTIYKRNSLLLNFISEKEKHNCLIEALRDANQSHIVNYLKGNGEYTSEFDGDWPLRKRELDILKANREFFIDNVSMDHLIDHLYATKVISKRQREFISSKATSYDKNKAFVEILSRHSLNGYWQTIQCLQESNQKHIATVLDHGGVVVRAVVKVVGEAQIFSRIEREIVSKISTLMDNLSLEEGVRVLDEVLQLRLIRAETNHSIALYFHCLSLDEVKRLKKVAKNGKLKRMVETVFSRLLAAQEKVRVNLDGSYKTSCSCACDYFCIPLSRRLSWRPWNYFKDKASVRETVNAHEKVFYPTSLELLPIELLDVILEKCYIQFYLNLCNHFQNVDVITHLASVSHQWSKQTSRRRFKRGIWRNLRVLCQKYWKRSTVYRNIQQYLVENIRKKGFLKELRSTGCLADKEIRQVNRFKGTGRELNRNAELLHLMMLLDDVRFPTFGRCLRNTQQNLSAAVLIHGRAPETGNVLIIGLSDGPRFTNDVLKINLNNPSEVYYVEEVSTSMKMEAAATVYQNTVYVVGLGRYANEIWKYETHSGWKKCMHLYQGRRKHSVAFVEEVLYICGGFVDEDERVLDSVEAYNAVTNKCTSVGKLVYPCESSGNCVSHKKSLYIFGGSNKDDKYISDVQVYDTVQNTCHLMPKPMPFAHNLMRAALWRESVILLGEENCFIYDFMTETWHVRKQFKTNVVHFGLALSNDRIYVIGGGIRTIDAEREDTWTCRDDVRSVSIKKIIDNKPVEWKVHAKLPKPCLVYASVSSTEAEHFEDYAVSVGLTDEGHMSRDVLKINLYCPSEIYFLQQLPTSGGCEAVAAVHQNTVYVVGIGESDNEIWKYDSKSGWEQCASLFKGRSRHSVAFVDEVLHIFGGYANAYKSVLDCVEAYNVVRNSCSSSGNLVVACHSSATCTYKRLIYIFGGSDKDESELSDVQVYDTVHNTCCLLSKQMPRGLSLMRAVMWQNSVIILGRFNCFVYNFENDTWQTRKQFKTDVDYFGLTLSKNRIYVIGGGTSQTYDIGRKIWRCRDDVRSVSIMNVIENKPDEWKFHVKLPQPCLISASGGITRTSEIFPEVLQISAGLYTSKEYI